MKLPSEDTIDDVKLRISSLTLHSSSAAAFPATTEAEASITNTMSARTSWHGVDVTVVVGDVVMVVVSQK